MVGPRSPVVGEGQTPHADRAYSGELQLGEGKEVGKGMGKGREKRNTVWPPGKRKRKRERARERKR